MKSDHPFFESALNAPQLEAVTYCDGPLLVIAGAGSGKTRVLTYKIAYLLRQGYEPWSILALTFTNKASREMNERIASLCGDRDIRPLWSGTFHSVFAKILRIEHEAIGYDRNYTIYDSADTRSLVKRIVGEMGLDDKRYKPSFIAGRISEAKNHLLTPDGYFADASILRRDEAEGVGRTHEIYTAYQNRLRAANAMDFDDLLLQTYLLLRDHRDVRARYQERFRYILVDEYQDTNKAQHHILALLTDPASRICVVGDDAQSIYGFRGADIANILDFQKQYPTAKVVKLECNYRSTAHIVEAANCIIRHNKGQLPKKVYSAGGPGDPLRLFCAETDKQEAQMVAERVVRLARHGVPYSEMAVLYRTNAQSRSFEEVMQKAGIPYRVYGSLSFYQRKEIKDAIAYFRLVVNPDDGEAFRRVVNYPARGIGETTLQRIQLAASASGVSAWQVASGLESHDTGVTRAAAAKVAAFCALIHGFREKAGGMRASDLAQEIVRRSGMAADLAAERSEESRARQENVDELLGSIQAYEKEVLEEEGRAVVPLSEFLATVSLMTDADQRDDGQPRVTLMTAHAAKGLEFDTVFVTGMEDELFPNSNAKLYPAEKEEERRLFYVAVTRAKNHCYLSYAKTRYRYGSLQFCDPSEFLDEIDSEYVESEITGVVVSQYSASAARPFTPSPRPYAPGARATRSVPASRVTPPKGFRPVRQLEGDFPSPSSASSSAPSGSPSGSPFSAPSGSPSGSPLRLGTRIRHERFGTGVIVAMQGSGGSAQVRVEFEECGVKNLLVKFAKFTVIGQTD